MTDKIHIDDGKVTISEAVIGNIAIIAAEEINGVSKITKKVTATITDIFSKTKQAQGVKVESNEGDVVIEISVELIYGTMIEEVARKIQKNIKQNVESMTGLNVKEVNVVITGLTVDKASLMKTN